MELTLPEKLDKIRSQANSKLQNQSSVLSFGRRAFADLRLLGHLQL